MDDRQVPAFYELTRDERHAVLVDSLRDVPEWRLKNYEAMRDGDGVFLPGGNLAKLMGDYLDRFGDLSGRFDELQFGRADEETAPAMRSILQGHLLAIVLLLERCDGLEYQRVENAEAQDA